MKLQKGLKRTEEKKQGYTVRTNSRTAGKLNELLKKNEKPNWMIKVR